MLTGKQEKFCQCVADGMTQADAYRAAYNAEKMKPESVQVKASVLMADGKIALRVAELRDALAKKALWTREESTRFYRSVVYDDSGEIKIPEKISAAKQMDLTHGFQTAKIDHTSSDGSMSPPKRVEISFVNAASQATE